MASAAYTNNGAIFITWDDPDITTPVPIGMIVVSPLVRAAGYVCTNRYDHSSTLRTFSGDVSGRAVSGRCCGRDESERVVCPWEYQCAGPGKDYESKSATCEHGTDRHRSFWQRPTRARGINEPRWLEPGFDQLRHWRVPAISNDHEHRSPSAAQRFYRFSQPVP